MLFSQVVHVPPIKASRARRSVSRQCVLEIKRRACRDASVEFLIASQFIVVHLRRLQ